MTEIATFGGGCFWCVEAAFQRLQGVSRVVSGYAGGHVENPTYRAVCNGTTGHAEVCQVSYDPGQIDYRDLLQAFFVAHDPTTLNRQGNDVGTQYRSIILYHNEEQKRIATEVIDELNKEGLWEGPIVTEVKAFEKFYSAEDYHQNYFNDNPNQGYCQFVIKPKLEKFEKVFGQKLKTAG